MAVTTLCNVRPCVFVSLHRKQTTRIHHSGLQFSKNTKLQLVLSNFSHHCTRLCHLSPLKSSSINGFSVQNSSLEHLDGEVNVDFNERIRRWIHFIQSILPGGSWWSFGDDVEVKIMAKPVTVWRALGKMWELVAEERLVIFTGFAALIVAALSEISIPHFLTASIFTAQSAEIAVFHYNVRLLILLCIASGICRLKSCMVRSPFSFTLQTMAFPFLSISKESCDHSAIHVHWTVYGAFFFFYVASYVKISHSFI